MTAKGEWLSSTSHFISEIKKREYIWNKTLAAANRALVNKQWEEIAEIFGGEQLTSEEKEEFVKSIKKRWRNIRDCFRKEVNKLKNLDNYVTNHTKPLYKYYKQLEFLHESGMNFDAEENNLENDNVNVQIDFSNKQFIGVMEKLIEQRKEDLANEKNGDRCFLLSLLPALSGMSKTHKAQTKIKMLQLVEETWPDTITLPSNVIPSNAVLFVNKKNNSNRTSSKRQSPIVVQPPSGDHTYLGEDLQKKIKLETSRHNCF